MEHQDARKLSPSAQEEKRRLAIKLWQEGRTQKEVTELVGTTQTTMSLWVKRYKEHGPSVLKSRRRGSAEGDRRHLSPSQEKQLQKLIADQAPDQLKLDYVLWTRKAVMELIEQETGLKMPIRTVGEYLKRWGFTPHKPAKRASEQNSKAVQQWLKEDYPKIKARAKREKAEIYWGDETGVRNDSQHERGYAPKGRTPLVLLNANRVSSNMISAISNQGKVRFKVFDGTMNAVNHSQIETGCFFHASASSLLIPLNEPCRPEY